MDLAPDPSSPPTRELQPSTSGDDESFRGLTDIHCHPSLNSFLFDRDLRRHYWAGSTFNPLSSLSDFRELERGGVRVAWCSHYVPEYELFDCRILRALAHLSRGGRKLLRLSAWECLLDMMDRMELQVARAPKKFAVARSNRDLDRILASGRRAIVHTVEGAHMLESRLDRLDTLAERGVASFTLAHLFRNDAAGHIEGIPESLRRLPLCPLDTGVEPGRGLTDFGRSIVDRLVELRIVPDLTHATGAARAEILDRVDGRLPVIASHTGAKKLNPADYNLEDAEITRIAATGGVVGVIFMPYWLACPDPRVGLDAIWETMRHVREVTGDWRSVAIGTDFDGFTDPPDDLAGASRLPKVEAMLRAKRLAPRDIDRILGGNARRVLRAGWR